MGGALWRRGVLGPLDESDERGEGSTARGGFSVHVAGLAGVLGTTTPLESLR
jgi:hypothetical protein